MSDFWSTFAPQNTAAQADTGLYAITDHQMLSVEGPDSAKFMQGQFTCNLTDITTEAFRRGACCNPKGRMITSFSLAQTAENSYLIAMSDSLIETAKNHLKKYMVFFKTEMNDSDWIMVGLKGPQAQSILEATFGKAPSGDFEQNTTEQGIVLKLPFEGGYELWLKPDTAQQLLENLNQQCPFIKDGAWAQVRIEAGLGHITSASHEALIPQMMNLPQTGGVSFNKGCYTGQEIVARMQYLGKLKRHMYRVAFTREAPPSDFAAVTLAGKDSPVGQVINYTRTNSNQYDALIVLEDKQLAALNDLSIENSSPLQLLDLPYEVAPPKEK